MLIKLRLELGTAIGFAIRVVGNAAVVDCSPELCFRGLRGVAGCHPCHEIRPCFPGSRFIAGRCNVPPRQRGVRVRIRFPEVVAFDALSGLVAVAGRGIVAQLHDDLIRMHRGIKALRRHILLAVAEVADTVEDVLALLKAFLVAVVADENGTGVELHRVHHPRVIFAAVTDIGVVLVEQPLEHGIVHVLGACHVQLDVEVALPDGVIRHRIGAGRCAIRKGELAFAVDVDIAGRCTIRIRGCALALVGDILVRPVVLAAATLHNHLDGASGHLIALIRGEPGNVHLDDTQLGFDIRQLIRVDVAVHVQNIVALIASHHLVRIGCIGDPVIHNAAVGQGYRVCLCPVQPHIAVVRTDDDRHGLGLVQAVGAGVGCEPAGNSPDQQEHLIVSVLCGDIVLQFCVLALAQRHINGGLLRGQRCVVRRDVQANAIRHAGDHACREVVGVLDRIHELCVCAVRLRAGSEQVVPDGSPASGRNHESGVPIRILLVTAIHPIIALRGRHRDAIGYPVVTVCRIVAAPRRVEIVDQAFRDRLDVIAEFHRRVGNGLRNRSAGDLQRVLARRAGLIGPHLHRPVNGHRHGFAVNLLRDFGVLGLRVIHKVFERCRRMDAAHGRFGFHGDNRRGAVRVNDGDAEMHGIRLDGYAIRVHRNIDIHLMCAVGADRQRLHRLPAGSRRCDGRLLGAIHQKVCGFLNAGADGGVGNTDGVPRLVDFFLVQLGRNRDRQGIDRPCFRCKGIVFVADNDFDFVLACNEESASIPASCTLRDVFHRHSVSVDIVFRSATEVRVSVRETVGDDCALTQRNRKAQDFFAVHLRFIGQRYEGCLIATAAGGRKLDQLFLFAVDEPILPVVVLDNALKAFR